MRMLRSLGFLFLTLLLISGCNQSTSVSGVDPFASDFTVSAVTPSKTLVEPIAGEAFSDAIVDAPVDDPSIDIQRFRVGHHMVECEGFVLSQCLVHTQSDQVTSAYLYENIEGFEFEWGHEYELLVAVTDAPSELADTAQKQYSLIKILSKSTFQREATFEYITRHTNRTITKAGTDEYLLMGSQPFVCEPQVCIQLATALDQEHAAIMVLQYGSVPGSPLRLAAVNCAESKDAFNDACISN